jgi:heat shock protein HslJ
MESLPEIYRAQLRAADALREGRPVVVASPSPLTYGIVARDAGALDQPVALSVHAEAAHDQLFRYLKVPTAALAMLDFALAERMSVQAPIQPTPTMPEYLAPAIQDGWVLFFDGVWGSSEVPWLDFPFLYASASTHRAGTIIRVDSDGRPSVHRAGLQDEAAGGPDVLLGRLLSLTSSVAELDGSSSSTPLGHTYLSTVVVADGKQKQLVPQTRIRLEFVREPNKNKDGPRVWDVLRAHVGCNRMGAATAAGELLTAGTIWIEGLGGTAVGCEPALRDQEEWLKTFLTSRPSWRLNGDELTLVSGGTTITLLDRKVAEPDFSLDGIKWTITTTITNADARRGYGRTEEAWLTFNAGHLTGWTGSNDLSATYTRNNTELTFTNVTVTNRPSTPESTTMQAAILATLTPAVAYTIAHNQLTLIAPSGKGLDLTAS